MQHVNVDCMNSKDLFDTCESRNNSELFSDYLEQTPTDFLASNGDAAFWGCLVGGAMGAFLGLPAGAATLGSATVYGTQRRRVSHRMSHLGD